MLQTRAIEQDEDCLFLKYVRLIYIVGRLPHIIPSQHIRTRPNRVRSELARCRLDPWWRARPSLPSP